MEWIDWTERERETIIIHHQSRGDKDQRQKKIQDRWTSIDGTIIGHSVSSPPRTTEVSASGSKGRLKEKRNFAMGGDPDKHGKVERLDWHDGLTAIDTFYHSFQVRIVIAQALHAFFFSDTQYPNHPKKALTLTLSSSTPSSHTSHAPPPSSTSSPSPSPQPAPPPVARS